MRTTGRGKRRLIRSKRWSALAQILFVFLYGQWTPPKRVRLSNSRLTVPLVADIHFDYRIALKVAEYGVDRLRINPGNIGNEERIRMVVDCARDKHPYSYGVNAGSLEKIHGRKNTVSRSQALLNQPCAMSSSRRLNFDQFKVSVKASDAPRR